MPAKPKGSLNTKVGAAREKQAANQAVKDAANSKKQEAQQEKEWQDGANLRLQSKHETAAQKADEAARKKREKEELLAAEEALLGSGSKGKTSKNSAVKGGGKGKKKPQNDLSMLEDALQSAADKKVKQKKQEELAKQQQQQLQQQLAAMKAENDNKPVDPLLLNTQSMMGAAGLHMKDDDRILVGRQANVAQMQEGMVGSGLDAALSVLNVSGGVGNAAFIKSAKALYNEFEERMMPIVKEEYPGLRLSQYKEKIWAMWKKSPENPANQIPVS